MLSESLKKGEISATSAATDTSDTQQMNKESYSNKQYRSLIYANPMQIKKGYKLNSCNPLIFRSPCWTRIPHVREPPD